MYHGASVPGFPQHPHRGFETITYVREGVCDHSDSLGAKARFGQGDTQWMTAGSGIVHAEMFPLLDRTGPNRLELFQIWLNLPADDKMVAPYFTMLWNHETPVVHDTDTSGAATHITVIAGSLLGVDTPAPPPDSWAAKSEADVELWHVVLEPGARWTMPAALGDQTQRMLYCFDGSGVEIEGEAIPQKTGAQISCDRPLQLVGGSQGAQCLMLQGRPINEPVAQYGPFVMNDEAGIRQTLQDYQQTGFGGWPWPTDGPNHGAEQRRFARHSDGKLEEFAHWGPDR